MTDRAKWLTVKQGELLPVYGGPLDGSTLPVSKILHQCFGEDAPPASHLIEGHMYSIDYKTRRFVVVGRSVTK